MVMIILAIETSLDDTCAAVTQDHRVLSNLVASQVQFHAEWGGTVPDIARRKHQEWLDPIINKAVRTAGIKPHQIDAVAVTYGPGLAPSLEVGLEHAKAWAKKLDIPLVPVNHLEAHLLATLATPKTQSVAKQLAFPALGFVISGGHTELVLIQAIGDYYLLGETLDDAAGEAYDKVARMLNLGYPGGPILAEMAKEGKPVYKLPEPMLQRTDLNFSFSGLKTAAATALKKLENVHKDRQFIADFSASFETAVSKHLTRRLERAIKRYQPRSLILGGGVVSNVFLRKSIRQVARKYHLPVMIPYSKKLVTDNAAMIGVTAWYQYQHHRIIKNSLSIDRQPNLNFSRLDSTNSSTPGLPKLDT
jgi:N6-L-threonylcarbamoyladenine synthase